MINSVTLAGNLTKDIEIRATASGTSVGRGSIAVNKPKKDASGNWTKEPHFFNFVAFGKRAENMQRFTNKGSKITITGELSQNRWTDQNGNNLSAVEVLVNDFEFMSSSSSSNGNATHYEPVPDREMGDVYDVDIPF